MPTTPRVQGAKSDLTVPERYAWKHRRHEKLDRAVRRVREADPIRGAILWELYVSGPKDKATGRMDERRMAEEHGITQRTFRRWKAQAQAMFLSEIDAVDVA